MKWLAIKFDFPAFSLWLSLSLSLSSCRMKNEKSEHGWELSAHRYSLWRQQKSVNRLMCMLHIQVENKIPSCWSSKGFHFFVCVWTEWILAIKLWVSCNGLGLLFFFLFRSQKRKIIEHFISKRRKMTTNNRHMIIMTLSVHDLIASYRHDGY